MKTEKQLKDEWAKAQENIKGYHIHIYYDVWPTYISLEYSASELANSIEALLGDHVLSCSHIGKVGPHIKPNYCLSIEPEAISVLLPWLQMNNHKNLSVLVHPETGDNLEDHTSKALWFGKALSLNTDVFRRP